MGGGVNRGIARPVDLEEETVRSAHRHLPSEVQHLLLATGEAELECALFRQDTLEVALEGLLALMQAILAETLKAATDVTDVAKTTAACVKVDHSVKLRA